MADIKKKTNKTDFLDFDRTGNEHFVVDETHWGYVIRSTCGQNVFLMTMQWIAMILGGALMAAAVGLMFVPEILTGSADLSMRAVAALLMGGTATYLLWFSSRGSVSEWQIDNNLGEIREVIRDKTGATTLIGRHGFDAIGGVFLDCGAGGNDQAALHLRFGNSTQTAPVATGNVRVLETLRDRLGHDLILEKAKMEPLVARTSRDQAEAA